MFLREKLFLQLIAYSEDKEQKFQIIKCISPFPEKSDQKCPESRFLQSFLLVFSVTIFI